MTEERLKILIADDEAAARFAMRRVLEKADYDVAESEDGNATIEKCRSEAPDILFLDLNMPGADGMKVLEKLSGMDVAPLVIVVTAHGSEKIAVEAMKSGAYDYVAKPYNIDELRHAAHRAAETIRLRRETQKLRSDFDLLKGYGRLVGQSASMQDVFRRIERVADTDATVLITGQSGTGKELVAREIHRRSARRDRPLVIVNCAAMPETLVESELFGYEKGAFTGADDRRQGKFEAANGGTLFLDEIADMRPGTQAKVLRILEEQSFERLGSSDPIHVNVRLVSATNRDLDALVEKGRFREDLYFRLKVVEIRLPPLSERREDIPLLAGRFLQALASKHNRGAIGIEPDAMRALVAFDWPGNVRQLSNVIEGGVVLATGDTIGVDELPVEIVNPSGEGAESLQIRYDLPFRDAKQEMVRAFELSYFKRKLDEHGGNITHTAEALGMQRQNLQQKLRDLGIR